MRDLTPVVKQLLIINILFFVGSLIVPLSRDYLALYFVENSNFKIWQPLTSMFMHGGITHIAFNMLALTSFGSTLEHFWGPKRFLIFYFGCGLGAAFVHLASNYYFYNEGLNYLNDIGLHDQITKFLSTGEFNYTTKIEELDNDLLSKMYMAYNIPAVGASGAIYGLLIAFAFMFPEARLSLMFIPVPLPAKFFVPIYLFLYDGFFGILGTSLLAIDSGVAHFAHLGGALFGFLFMMYWRNNKFKHNRWN